MSNAIKNEKTTAFLDYFNNTQNSYVELLVEGIGWLIVLKDSIEIVSDNWFASTKYLSSKCDVASEGASCLIHLKNVYQKNSTFIDNANNMKYNMIFDELNIFADKIVAFF